jgi:hypothetical protein
MASLGRVRDFRTSVLRDRFDVASPRAQKGDAQRRDEVLSVSEPILYGPSPAKPGGRRRGHHRRRGCLSKSRINLILSGGSIEMKSVCGGNFRLVLCRLYCWLAGCDTFVFPSWF